MSEPAFIADPSLAPYNVAYIVDDRSQCYREYDVDRDRDHGPVDPARDAPVDYAARREAILAFYGGRCGRCGTAVATQSAEETSLGYVYSVASESEPAWALSNLVALCEPCYDMLSASCCRDLGAFGDTYRRAPQFPTWTCDPRVAVERLPLTGREAWLRHRLADRIDDQPACRANRTVARSACLARATPAAEAVALGEAFVRDERGALSTANTRLRDRWHALTDPERADWEACAVDPDTSLVTGGFEPALERHPV
ncbi:hypothetical protein G9C85_16680 [Halorubellus sp. JP-L1]|uniref:hypothetical protein n=1 Tax=Halorubellus sp. JP-L1 TaxID=2715753 RepID=UPI001408E464|nr:hypothetical protein [Halorubellus sp. JP-L1]NHN43254.1 hypothetical protein [Halorubellus sp. JP-L1]